MCASIKKHMVFCFPYRGAGGVPLLFLRLAIELSKQNHHISIVDYKNGYMIKNLPPQTPIKTIYYTDNTSVKIPNNAILIFQTMTPWSIYPSLDIPKKTYLFFITTIPTNLFPALPGIRSKTSTLNWLTKLLWSTILRSEYTKCKTFLELSLKENAISFLDTNISCNIENAFNLTLPNATYIPLFSDEKKENSYLSHKRPVNEIHLAWVGRIADFKIHILNQTIKDIEHYATHFNQKITFHIIGSGNKMHRLHSPKTHNISVIKKNHISPQNLPDYLLKTHMVFAMGTSALESAKLGIPTIRLDYSYAPVSSNYLYKYLFDIKGHSLGDQIGTPCYQKGTHTMKNILKEIKENPSHLSQKTFNFYQKNHSIKSSTSLFSHHIKKTTLIWNKLSHSKLTNSLFFSMWKKLQKYC